MSARHQIYYTLTDEAPALATYSLLPILQAFLKPASVELKVADISLAARILAQFSDQLPLEQRREDHLALLGNLTQDPQCNIIKLPNISASLPQLKAAISELQKQGYALPDYPSKPRDEAEKAIQARYAAVIGSAVNPVLREGNSDRRAPKAVKAYAQKNPHRMGAWSPQSKTRVASMAEGDFYANERSYRFDKAQKINIVLVNEAGEEKILRSNLAMEAGEIIDASFLSRRALRDYIAEQVAAAKAEGLLFSVHLKATMMKVSDPIIFGQFVEVFFAEFFRQHGAKLSQLGYMSRSGLKALENALTLLPEGEEKALRANLAAAYAAGPDLAMVNSDLGITNLHMPNDVIIDASMPAMIRSSGQMWNKNNQTQDTLACIPDRSYAGVYQECIDFCREHGALDPASMGSVSNVGLMAQKAEEYGSHDKTFELSQAGCVEARDRQGTVLLSHKVEEGDIWRMCQTKAAAVENWVALALRRAAQSGEPAVFWLDEQRAHDREIRKMVESQLAQTKTEGLELHIMNPEAATRYSLERAKAGLNTISVTGNVLRDYLTDLFPILELGTSAKMLSIVPLMEGGGLFETGAGGSAPKHVEQLVKENHLRWDSLGEFLALAASLEHLAHEANDQRLSLMAECLDQATQRYLDENKSPSHKVHEPDNRHSHFYLALFWAQALGGQKQDAALAQEFKLWAEKLVAQAPQIQAELLAVQGQAAALGGYFHPDSQRAEAIMRPSDTWNQLLAALA